jgi:chromosome partitioning protein
MAVFRTLRNIDNRYRFATPRPYQPDAWRACPYNHLMGSVIAVANQKGGVAKTTTVHTLSAALAERGRRVLMVDLDPQACLTYENGFDPDDLEATVHDVMLGRAKIAEVIVKAGDMDIVPSSIDLAGSEIHLLTKTGREFVLGRALKPVSNDYDYVFIDCAPSLGILTLNGLTAATHVLIPFQAETLSHRAVGQLLETIDDVRVYTNPDLEILGAVATMFDARTNLSKRVLEEVSEMHDIDVIPPPIPRSVKVAEAPGRGRSVLTHARRSKSAVAYRDLAGEIERRT